MVLSVCEKLCCAECGEKTGQPWTLVPPPVVVTAELQVMGPVIMFTVASEVVVSLVTTGREGLSALDTCGEPTTERLKC